MVDRIESMARARAARVGKAATDAMSIAELIERASAATTLTAQARWLRKIVARGESLTEAQQATLRREHERVSKCKQVQANAKISR